MASGITSVDIREKVNDVRSQGRMPTKWTDEMMATLQMPFERCASIAQKLSGMEAYNNPCEGMTTKEREISL